MRRHTPGAMDPKKPKRSDGNSTLTISLSKALKDQILAAAEADRRTTSNWCVARFTEILEAAQPKTVIGFNPVQAVAETAERSEAADAPRKKTVYPKGTGRKAN
jgi:hypothetical protein